MGGFFVSLGGACSFPPSDQKTPDTARAFFGLSDPLRMESCLPPSRGPESPKGPPDLSGDPDGPGDRLRWKEFFLSVVSPVFLPPSLTPSVAYGDSSLKREPSPAPFLFVGREPPLASGERHRIPPRGEDARHKKSPAVLSKQKAAPSLPGRLLGEERLCSRFLCSLPLQKVFCLLFFRKVGLSFFLTFFLLVSFVKKEYNKEKRRRTWQTF